MSWFEIYRIADGTPVSGTRDPTKVASPELLGNLGFRIKEFPDGAQFGIWNRQTLQFDPAPPQPVTITPFQLMSQFTGPEVKKIFDSINPALTRARILIQMRVEPINLQGQVVSQILNLVANLGLFDGQASPGAPTTRPDEILAFRPPAREL